MALITCEHVCLGYDGQTVLRDVNFTVSRGDLLCVVGENGSGKSTLIKGLLGLKAPEQGRITLGDGLVRNEIGYLPQQTQLQRDFPASVAEVVRSGCINQMHGRPFYSRADRARAQENMERMGIEDLANRSYQALSGGQQQRVLLARALCAADRLLILDEPVTGLDPAATQAFRNVLPGLNPGSVAGRRPVEVSHADGLRLQFDDGSWVLMRPSRSDPVVRVYSEAPTEGERDRLLDASCGMVRAGA